MVLRIKVADGLEAGLNAAQQNPLLLPPESQSRQNLEKRVPLFTTKI
jgi:hypothetical protein